MRTLLRNAATNVKLPTCLHSTAYAPLKFTTARSWFPLLRQTHDGSRAIGAKRIDTPADLTPEVLADPKLMFCQLIDIEKDFPNLPSICITTNEVV